MNKNDPISEQELKNIEILNAACNQVLKANGCFWGAVQLRGPGESLKNLLVVNSEKFIGKPDQAAILVDMANNFRKMADECDNLALQKKEGEKEH